MYIIYVKSAKVRNTNSPEEKSEISGGGRILSAFGFIFGFFTDVRNDINCNEKNKIKIPEFYPVSIESIVY